MNELNINLLACCLLVDKKKKNKGVISNNTQHGA